MSARFTLSEGQSAGAGRGGAGRIASEELRPGPAPRAPRSARVPSGGAPLEPRDAGGILDLAIEGLLLRLGPALALSLCIWLPFNQVAELLGLAGLDEFEADLASLAWNALSIVPLGLTAALVVSLVADALVDPRAPLAPSILRGLARAPGAIALLLATQFLTLPLMFLCLAPYFLVLWLTWAAVPIYVLEGELLLDPAERARAHASLFAYLASIPRRFARALRRSVALARSARSLGRWLLLAIVGQLVLGGMFELGALALTHPEAREYLRTELGLGGAAAELALGAAAALFTALSACLRAAMMVAYYLDLRVRCEGLDLERALENVAAERA